MMLIPFLLLFSSQASAFSNCDEKSAQDKSLRTAIEALHANYRGWADVQKQLKETAINLKSKPEFVDALKWCQCVESNKKNFFGGELYSMMSQPEQSSGYKAWLAKLPPLKALEHNSHIKKIEYTCYNESYTSTPQKADDRAPAKTLPSVDLAKLTNFEHFMISPLHIGKGIGDLEINAPADFVTTILGAPTKRRVDGEFEFLQFGPTGVEVLITVSPPGGQLKSVVVNETYKGQTSNGISIHDPFDTVKLKMGRTLILSETQKQLIYDNGMSFIFDHSTPPQVIRIGISDPNHPNIKKLRTKNRE